MIPTRRDLHFKLLPSSVSNWHAKGPYVTQFTNAMSIFFPEGERFFIHTVRHYRDHIHEPQLKKAVTAFIGQEAMHGREHDEHNRLLNRAGLPADELERQVKKFLVMLEEKLPPAAQLSITIAQEHFTAIMAEIVLTDPRILAGADARLKAMWRWHALEEIEHKAVAFDVYEAVMGRGIKAYALRNTSLVITTLGFLSLVLYYQQRMLKADSHPRSWKDFGAFAKFMLISPALLPKLALPWLSYMRPGFHPWDHDNRDLLKEMNTLVAKTKKYELQAA
ncbi:metal-dependent hydrolase [Stenotrophobium rhamnosiphilum]|uniref:Metal-dependent hydrolase n=1 Tax=Stenotrophobium rhamnosiphilum TaxID=2029166 RepID=A0A2T5MCA4_9GAMM|nr:metal-dependent hydrolase [Stenotrophobium rhamnosiphilum]PTU30195.1 metal-dependent hydrolase [Stenotrophobium rhamnosiphilum]